MVPVAVSLALTVPVVPETVRLTVNVSSDSLSASSVVATVKVLVSPADPGEGERRGVLRVIRALRGRAAGKARRHAEAALHRLVHGHAERDGVPLGRARVRDRDRGGVIVVDRPRGGAADRHAGRHRREDGPFPGQGSQRVGDVEGLGPFDDLVLVDGDPVPFERLLLARVAGEMRVTRVVAPKSLTWSSCSRPGLWWRCRRWL